ncbi:MAG: HAD-IA family hydrolase [Hyphomonadaceae bacterium]|nr:HAD-IA family hydrolase [Hyphomonadaceae bacterium]
MKRLAVFDLDGTLIDSRATIDMAVRQAWTELRLEPPSYDQTRQIVGLSLLDAVRILAPDLDPSRYPELSEAYKNAFLTNRAKGHVEPLYDGALDMLAELKREGWLLGIATGKARRGIRHFYDRHGAEHFFDAAFCADDGPGKPDPHMLRLNMQALDVDPAQTIMIGDTTHDMKMARAAGAYALGVSWGFHTRDEVAGDAHAVVDDFPTLGEHLVNWRASADN